MNNQPHIPEDVLKRMTEFFLKTSIPRILEEKEKEGATQNEA